MPKIEEDSVIFSDKGELQWKKYLLRTQNWYYVLT